MLVCRFDEEWEKGVLQVMGETKDKVQLWEELEELERDFLHVVNGIEEQQNEELYQYLAQEENLTAMPLLRQMLQEQREFAVQTNREYEEWKEDTLDQLRREKDRYREQIQKEEMSYEKGEQGVCHGNRW